jgi:hypothetical protein
LPQSQALILGVLEVPLKEIEKSVWKKENAFAR